MVTATVNALLMQFAATWHLEGALAKSGSFDLDDDDLRCGIEAAVGVTQDKHQRQVVNFCKAQLRCQ